MSFTNKIFSRRTRIKIMRALSFLPDKFVVKVEYKLKTGRKLNLKNPERYTEKLQWYKLNYKNPVLSQCVDKYDVRKFVAEKGCSEILNDCLGVFENIADIDYDALPNKFVCKDTLGSGSMSVIVFNKETDDIKRLNKNLGKWLREPTNKKHPGREWPYDNRKHRILIEKTLEPECGDLVDYKFFCFNGQVKCFYVRTGYSNNHDDGKMMFFDRRLNVLSGVYMNYCKLSENIPTLPDGIEEMIAYAEKLSAEFPHVRVDLYNVDGKIVFGELTFYNASGYMKFIPDEFDFTMGDYFTLPKPMITH